MVLRGQRASRSAPGATAGRSPRLRSPFADRRDRREVRPDHLHVERRVERPQPLFVQLDARFEEVLPRQETITPTFTNSPRSTLGTTRMIA